MDDEDSEAQGFQLSAYCFIPLADVNMTKALLVTIHYHMVVSTVPRFL
jgi:dihydroneopterin aldolase